MDVVCFINGTNLQVLSSFFDPLRRVGFPLPRPRALLDWLLLPLLLPPPHCHGRMGLPLVLMRKADLGMLMMILSFNSHSFEDCVEQI